MIPRQNTLLPLVATLFAAGLVHPAAGPNAPDARRNDRTAGMNPAARRRADAAPLPAAQWVQGLAWRSIGPAAMGGRIVAVSVYEADPSTYWVATASGGLLKTRNNGVTFEHQFDHERTVSLGDVCVAPSDRNIVWVGTGENNPRNSVSYGDGVYQSTDGGKTWKHRGLRKSFQVGRVVVHPRNPDVVYVGALGRLYGPNEERGLYKTTDGGRTWNKVLHVDDRTGVIDVRMSPADPETLLVATYERQRDGFDTNDPAKKWGPGSGLYRTTDGGKTFTRLTRGLPTCTLGRIGVCYSRKDPRTVYAVVESEKIGMGPPRVAVELPLARRPPGQPALPGVNPNRPYGTFLGGQEANVQDRQGPEGFEYGGVYRSTDGGASWVRVNSLNPRPMYFSQVRVDPSDDQRVYVLGIAIHRSTDGGKTFQDDVGGIHGDHHALWIDPRDGRHMLVGNDGGLYVTHDRMQSWDRLNHVAIGQFYHVAVDSRRPYRVYGGLQDNGVWAGPSRTLTPTGPVNEDWLRLSGRDGFVCRVAPDDPDLVYYETQWGSFARRNLRTGEATLLRPQPGPGTRLRAGPQRRGGGRRYRFNWNAPFLLSHRNPRIFYGAGNVVFRSLDRGDDLRVISPEVTRTSRGSATALAESPRNPDVLWAGTDDGYLWVTRDGGRAWTNVTANVGLPGPRWVARVEASRYEEGRAYVAFDGHRSDDDEPHVYVTTDFGKTWKSLRANLPWGSTRVLQEDVYNPDLLFLGTEFGAWASLDRGASWIRLNTNLPTVAVHEFAFHPASGEVVAATHGRSLWVLDATPLRQMTPPVLQARAHLFRPNPAVRWRAEPGRGGTSRRFVGENPPAGARLYYALAAKAKSVSLRVVDHAGRTVRGLPAKTGPGLHRVTWDLTRPPTRPAPGEPADEPEGMPVPPGTYRVVLSVDGQELTQDLRVEADPSAAPSAPAAEGGRMKDGG